MTARDFSATQASVFLDGFTFRRFLEDCYAENVRRMGGDRHRNCCGRACCRRLAGLALSGVAAVELRAGLGSAGDAMKGRLMRWAAVGAMLAGLALMTLLVAHFGIAEVGHAIAAAGWTCVIAISGIHLLLVGVMGLAWWLLARHRSGRGTAWTFIWGRLLRDAGSELLPLSQVGGYVLGVRAVTLRGVGTAIAAASMVVDVTLEPRRARFSSPPWASLCSCICGRPRR